ncbi:hypothetical protein GF351_05410, partial [Candidatus Woesearchaeota archaeon]|nr:hypothetical protein [Candidatus Woesearchaeota archaeon]
MCITTIYSRNIRIFMVRIITTLMERFISCSLFVSSMVSEQAKTEVLERVGLTRTESKVYLSLLDLGTALAGKITESSGIHRRSVYDAIERLMQKGLVSYVILNNRKHFEAVDPSRIMKMMEEKQDSLRNLMPELEMDFRMSKEKQETVFYKGKQALKSIFDQQIQDRKEILVFSASSNAEEIIRYYFPKYDRQRKKNKIKVKAIFNSEVKHDPP